MNYIELLFSNLGGAVIITFLLIFLNYAGVLDKLFGLIKKKNGDGTEHRFQDLEKHASVANEEMGEVKKDLVEIKTKLDIIMRHLKI